MRSQRPVRFAALLSALTLGGSLVAVAPAAPPARATVLTELSLVGPTVVPLGQAATFGGRLTALESAGVPGREVELRIDGAVAETVDTDMEGRYEADLAFAAYGFHSVQAIAEAGTALEEASTQLFVEVVPAYDQSAVTDLYGATEFLYTGPGAVQTGMAPGVVEPGRVALIRGRVTDREGAPLQGVAVTVAGEPDFGVTTTRADGWFDMVVNGGRSLVLRYQAQGRPIAERSVTAGWRDTVVAPDVVLVPYDTAATTVVTGAAQTQVARGSVSSDADGTRQATLLFPAGTGATMRLADDSLIALPSLTVRATEYTVGPSGEAAMPAPLPPASAYTYAVDFSVDEAVAAGAVEVSFDQPVVSYVENFLGFAVGTPVPTGWYDAERHAWIAEPDGVVLAVVSETGGLADVDVTGDGVADTGAPLAALGVTDAEREQLAVLYEPADTLWRVPVSHFSAWDYNWPFGLPTGATTWAEAPLPSPSGGCCTSGSVVGATTQTLGERISVEGTGLALVYDTARAHGYAERRTVRLPLTGDDPPPDLLAVTVDIEVAGRRFASRLDAEPNLSHVFTWDGEDPYGRPLAGEQTATVRVGYVYPAVPFSPVSVRSFGQPGTGAVTIGQARPEITLTEVREIPLGVLGGAARQSLGGLTLTAHHAYDPDARTLHFGDGGERRVSGLFPAIRTVAGTGAAGTGGDGTYTGDGGQATAAGLGEVHGLAMAADGTVYLADAGNGVVRRVGTDGVITTFAGGGSPASGNGDGGAATAARLETPVDVAVGPDGTVYVADAADDRVRAVAPDGLIRTVAGGGSPADGLGDGGPALDAELDGPRGVAVREDGGIYVADTGHDRVRLVTTDGVIRTVAGGGTPVSGVGDGLPGPQAKLAAPSDVAVGPGQRLFVADTGHHRVRLVERDGLVSTFAGDGSFGADGDGGLAVEGRVGHPAALAVDAVTGTLYVAQRLHHRVRAVGAGGVLTTVVGTGTAGFDGDGEPPLRARLREPRGVLAGWNGALYVADSRNFRVRGVTVSSPGRGPTELSVPDESGAEVYQFDTAGRHLRTVDGLTGLVTATFSYDSQGRLVEMADADGNVLAIDHAPDQIVLTAPFGHETVVELDGEGRAVVVRDPAGATAELAYGADGLLASVTDGRGETAEYSYDTLGRLTAATSRGGETTTLSRIDTDGGVRVTRTTPLGREVVFGTDRQDDGSETRTVTDETGLVVTGRRMPDGTAAVEAEGHSLSVELAPDPVWGMAAPRPAVVAFQARGRDPVVATSTRTVTLGDPDDPLSILSATDTRTVNGRVSTVAWDASTSTITTTTPEGRQYTTTLDGDGRVSTVEAGDLAVLTHAYDSAGRQVSATRGTGPGARSVAVTYGSDGLPGTVTDSDGAVTTYEHDANGRLTQAEDPGGTLQLAFDGNGNTESVTPPGRPPYTITRSADERLAGYTMPDAGAGPTSLVYQADADGDFTGAVLPGGGSVSFGRDTAGRLTSVARGTDTISYSYDADGYLTSATAPGGVVSSVLYDEGLPVGSSWSGPVAGTVSGALDDELRLVALDVAGTSFAATYDDDGLLTGAGAISLSRDGSGLVDATTAGVVTTTTDRNTFGEPDLVSAAAGATQLHEIAYTSRDGVGRILERMETVLGASTTTTYDYDAAGRLATVTEGVTQVAAFTFDAAGNVASAERGGVTVTGTYDDQDRLLQWGDLVFTHTPMGERASATDTVTADVTEYQWRFGRLVGVDLPGGPSVEYLLDAEGRRVRRAVDGVPQRGYLWWGDRLVAELDGSGTVLSRFVYASAGHVPDLMVNGGATYRILTDERGSPRLVVDIATGAVAQRLDYDVTGRITADTNPGFQPFGFAGGLADPDTGLVLFGQRVYDPETVRWLSRDRVGFSGGLNHYAYVEGDFVNRIDPTGLFGEWLDCVQEVAGWAGVFPVLGDIVDAANAGLYLLRGKVQEAGWSAAGIVMPGGLNQVGKHGTRILAKGGAKPVRTGQKLVNQVGFGQNHKTVVINGRARKPDILDGDSKLVGDVKNTKYQVDTRQLRDYRDIAKSIGGSAVLVVSSRTRMSKPLVERALRGELDIFMVKHGVLLYVPPEFLR